MRCKNLKVLFNNTYSDTYIKENVLAKSISRSISQSNIFILDLKQVLTIKTSPPKFTLTSPAKLSKQMGLVECLRWCMSRVKLKA